jgi:hypothetical protein
MRLQTNPNRVILRNLGDLFLACALSDITEEKTDVAR